jgi:hypothetical protein
MRQLWLSTSAAARSKPSPSATVATSCCASAWRRRRATTLATRRAGLAVAELVACALNAKSRRWRHGANGRHRHPRRRIARQRPGQERQLDLPDRQAPQARPGTGARTRSAHRQRRQLLRPLGSGRWRRRRCVRGIRCDPRHRRRRRHRGRRQGAERRQRHRRRVGPQPDAGRAPQGHLLLRTQGLHRALPFRSRPRGRPSPRRPERDFRNPDRISAPQPATRNAKPPCSATKPASRVPWRKSSTSSTPT